MVTKVLGLQAAPQLGIRAGATSPNPGIGGVQVQSTITGSMLKWSVANSRWEEANNPNLQVSKLQSALTSAMLAYNNNAFVRDIYRGRYALTTSASLSGSFSRTYTLGTTGHPFIVNGGYPVAATGTYEIPAVSLTGSTKQAVAWRVETILDGDAITFKLDANSTGYRFLINGQYVSRDAAASVSGSFGYYTFTFETKTQRHIVVEGSSGCRFGGASVKPVDAMIAPTRGSNLRMIVVGDSNIAGTGQALSANGFVRVMGDAIGIPDLWLSAVASTGFVATNGGTNLNYAQRRSDWIDHDADILVLTGSANDVNAGATAAQVKTACALELTTARAARPTQIILVLGMAGSRDYFTSQGLLSTFEAFENALSQAVSEANDPLIKFIPFLTVVGDTALTGTLTGSNGNSEAYTQPDGHLTLAGHLYMGHYMAGRVTEAMAEMVGASAPRALPRLPAGSVNTINDTAPSIPNVGDRWIRPIDGVESVWVPTNDGVGAWFSPASAAAANVASGLLKNTTDTFTGTLTMAGSIIPSADITFDLGSPTRMWRDLYVGPGSIYLNGKKILEDNSDTVTFSTDNDQNLRVQTSGVGNIELQTSAGGAILAKSGITLTSGKKILDSAGVKVEFGDDIDAGVNKVISSATPSNSGDLTNKNYVDNTIATAVSGREPTITAGATSDYRRGDKTWADFASSVRVAVLTGLSTATSTVVAATDSVLAAIGKLQAQLALKFDVAGGTLGGDVTISKASPILVLNKTSGTGQTMTINGRTNNINRWVISLGASDTETGSANAGSNFYITRCADNGTSLGDVMSINRNSGAVSFANTLNVGGAASVGGVLSVTSSVSTGLGYTALGYAQYMLASSGAQNNSGTLQVYCLSLGTGLGLTSTLDTWHTPGVNAGFRWVISGGVFEMRDNATGYSSGGWVATSDQRVKYDNQVITSALDKVGQLTGYTYLRQDMVGVDGVMPRKAGLIAQEVLKVLPESVVIPKDYDAEKNTGELLSLDSYGILGLHNNAIKELHDLVKAQALLIAELRSEVNALKG